MFEGFENYLFAEEAETLTELFENRAQEFQAVGISGEFGIGKTKFIEAWLKQIRAFQPTVIFQAGIPLCSTGRQSYPYFSGMLEKALGLTEAVQEENIRTSLLRLFPNEKHADFDWKTIVSELYLLWEEKPSMIHLAFERLLWLFRELSKESRCVLIFDDTFLLDSQGIRFIELLKKQEIPSVFVLFLGIPGELEEVVPYYSSLHHIQLATLDHENSLQFLSHLNDAGSVAESELEEIAIEGKGNPKLLSKLFYFYCQPQHETTVQISNFQVSLSLEVLCLRKLHPLSYSEQHTLRIAAMIGENFWQGALESLERFEMLQNHWGLKGGKQVAKLDNRSAVLEQLVRAGILGKRERSSIYKEDEFFFIQPALQNILSKQFPRSMKRKMHKKIAQWLLLQEPSYVVYPLAAHHFEQAEEHYKTIECLVEAGHLALERKMEDKAATLFRFALEKSTVEETLLKIKLSQYLTDISWRKFDFSHGEQFLKLILEWTWKIGDTVSGGTAYLQTAKLHTALFQYDFAEECLRNALFLFEKAKKNEKLVEAYLLLAQNFLFQGKRKEAEHYIQLSREFLLTSSIKQKAHSFLLEGLVSLFSSDWKQANVNFLASEKIAREHQEIGLLGNILSVKAQLSFMQGEEEQSLQPLWEASECLREHEPTALFLTLLWSAQTFLARRNPRSALNFLKEAWMIAKKLENKSYIALVASILASTYASVLKVKQAIYFARLAGELGSPPSPSLKGVYFHFLGLTARLLPDNLREKMMSSAPKTLPEGGLPTYFFVRALDSFENMELWSLYCRSILELGRSLVQSSFKEAGLNVFKRGKSAARKYNLPILEERFENQIRIVSSDGYIPTQKKPSQHTLMIRNQVKTDANG